MGPPHPPSLRENVPRPAHLPHISIRQNISLLHTLLPFPSISPVSLLLLLLNSSTSLQATLLLPLFTLFLWRALNLVLPLTRSSVWLALFVYEYFSNVFSCLSSFVGLYLLLSLSFFVCPCQSVYNSVSFSSDYIFCLSFCLFAVFYQSTIFFFCTFVTDCLSVGLFLSCYMSCLTLFFCTI